MKPSALIHSLVLSLAACGGRQVCPSCDDEDADDDPSVDMAPEIPDLPCGGADLQNDDQNCGTCGKECPTRGADEYEAGGCVDGVCGPIWFGQYWLEPTPLTCADVCTAQTFGMASCQANGCVGLTGFVCETISTEECDVLTGAPNPLLLLEISGPCDETIAWPEVLYGGNRSVFCCCG